MGRVQFQDLSKAFGPTQALADVSLEIEPGEVHALLGENGAGKSTLVKIASGVLAPDSGSVSIDGAGVALGSAGRSAAAGISTAFQELSLLGNLTVGETLLLPDLPRGRTGLISARALRRRAREILERWDLELSPNASVEGLSLASKQRLEIVKALSRDARLLILDEPTAALADVEWLFGHIRTVTAAGVSVLYISHRLPEIEEICDRGTVLRNGRVAGSFERETFDEERLVREMIGRSLEAVFPERGAAPAEGAMLEVRGLSVGDGLADVSVDVRKGEVVGVSALEGQGQRELFYTLYGLSRASAGEVLLDGRPVTIRNPRGALRARTGIALVPEERKTEGLFLELPGRDNLTLPIISEIARGGLIPRRRERARAEAEAQRVNVDPAALERPVGRLSGGNQQKVVIGKTLLTGARCLLLFDPTRGIDAATKFEIYELIRRLAADGGAILLYSTEIPELVGLCDRVYTLYGGRVSGEFGGERITEAGIMRAVVGQRPNGNGAHQGADQAAAGGAEHETGRA